MIVIDPGDPLAADFIDGGDTASPPTDIFDSQFLKEPQTVTGIVQPTFTAVDTNEVVNPEPGLVLVVRAGGTATTVTVTVPGAQPYTGAARDDLVVAGVQNGDRAFWLPEYLAEFEVVSVSYNPTTGVSAALVKVD